MSIVLEQTTVAVPPQIFGGGEIYYPSSESVEMGETTIHFKLIRYLSECLENFFAARADVLVAANLMLYYDEGKPRNYYVPDVFVAFGVPNYDRRIYKFWEEKQFPQVVIEVASDSTAENDLGKKYLDYGKFGVQEYYLLDPERAYLPAPVMAFKRGANDRLLLAPLENGRIFSPLLNLEFVDTDDEIRLFDSQTNSFLLSARELAAKVAKLEALLKAQK